MFPYEFDLSWVIAFQALGDWLVLPMRIFSFLGTEEFYILIMPILYWCIDAGLGIRVGTIMLLSSGLNSIFKIPFTGPRPYWMSAEVKALWAETSFGIPSGHAQQSVAVWGSMAAFFRHRWAWGIAVFLMIMIGLSRVFLGAHFFLDMFAGWLVGALLLWLYLRFWDPLATWAGKQSLGMQILYAFLVSIGMVLLGWIVVIATGDFVLPEDWITNAARIGDEEIAPFAMSGILTSAGTLFGLLTGVAWMASRGGWQATGPDWKRAARYLVGLLGVLVIWYGLGLVFPRGEAFIPFVLRFARYALLGLWVSAGAPLFFMKLKLS
jgi:membrane-associated phospholipid phosphatase